MSGAGEDGRRGPGEGDHSIHRRLARRTLAALCCAAGLYTSSVPYSGPARAEDAAAVRWPTSPGRVEIRRPFGGSTIVVGASSRTAGAIDSLVWKGQQFVNAFDHGREWQAAASFDGYGECFNPTEAGSAGDASGERSTSLLLGLRTGRTWLETRSDMAFWMGTAQAARDCPTKPPRYAAPRAGYTLTKRVTIGAPGVPNAITFRTTFRVPRPFENATFEAPTGYMPAEFSRFFTYDPVGDRLAPLADGPGEQERPVILSTPDGAHAVGVYSPDLPDRAFANAGYGRFRFATLPGPGNATVKWNCVFRKLNGAAGDHRFLCHALVGSLEDVQRGMRALHRARR